MCPNDPEQTTKTETETALPSKAQQLLVYLSERVEQEGTCYLKSRYIAEEIELSAKEVGAYLPRVDTASDSVTVEKWGYTNGTTWRITKS